MSGCSVRFLWNTRSIRLAETCCFIGSRQAVSLARIYMFVMTSAFLCCCCCILTAFFRWAFSSYIALWLFRCCTNASSRTDRPFLLYSNCRYVSFICCRFYVNAITFLQSMFSPLLSIVISHRYEIKCMVCSIRENRLEDYYCISYIKPVAIVTNISNHASIYCVPWAFAGCWIDYAILYH
jgi:hypothetical protein